MPLISNRRGRARVAVARPRQYVDIRQAELRMIGEFLGTAEEHRVVVLHGIAGSGKSYLLRAVFALASDDDTVVFLDGASTPDSTADDMMHFMGRQIDGRNLRVREKQAEELHRRLTQPPAVTVNTSVTVTMTDLSIRGSVGDVGNVSLEGLSCGLSGREGAEILRRVRREKLDALAADFRELRGERVWLFIDGLDRLDQAESKEICRTPRQWLLNEALPTFLEVEDPTFRVVVASQRPFSDLEVQALEVPVEQIELGPLVDSDAERICRERLGSESASSVREAVKRLADGHVMCLTLACEAVNLGMVPEGSFEDVFESLAVSRFLATRIVQFLPADLRFVVEEAAVLKWFDADLLSNVVDDSTGGARIDQLTQLSFVRSRPLGGWEMHGVVRRHLEAMLRRRSPEEYRYLNNRAIEAMTYKLHHEGSPRRRREMMVRLIWHRAKVDEGACAAELRRLVLGGDLSFDATFCQAVSLALADVEVGGIGAGWRRCLAAHHEYLSGNWETAERMYSEELGRQASDSTIGAQMNLSLGVLYREMGNLGRSLSHLQDSLKAFEALADSAGMIGGLLELGNTYRVLIEFEKAFEAYTAVTQLTRSTGESVHMRYAAFAQLYSAVVLTGWGRWEEAELAAGRALEVFRRIGDEYGVARACHRHGYIARLRGRRQDAISWHERALAHIGPFGYAFSEAEIIHSLGNVFRENGDFESAVVRYESAQETFHAAGARRHELIVRNDWAALMLVQGQNSRDEGLVAKAQVELEAIVANRQELRHHREMAASLYLLGEARTWQGDYMGAEDCFEKSLEVARRTHVPSNECRALVGLCELNLFRQRPEEVRLLGAKALEIAGPHRFHHYSARVWFATALEHLWHGEITEGEADIKRGCEAAARYNPTFASSRIAMMMRIGQILGIDETTIGTVENAMRSQLDGSI